MSQASSPAQSGTTTPPKRERDLRLDFYRGLGMFIIFIAHTPWNPWTLWIPARFGFSDATEMFVFCSGMASAIAFGAVFEKAGWLMGAARIVHRIWQVYWAHICLFLIVAGMLFAADQTGWFWRNYTNSLNLTPFVNDPGQQLPGLLSLTYVPNYFDILPMYLVILALIPVLMGIAKLAGEARAPYAVGAFVIALWVAANLDLLNLPAEPWSERPWFFNPFGWQLVFFTGFAFIRGWLPAPPINRWLVGVSTVIIVASVPVNWHKMFAIWPELLEFSRDIKEFREKTQFGILRYIHFLALAYLAYAASGEGGWRLQGGGLWGGFVAIVRKVGQQSLAVFLASLIIAQAIGIAEDMTGKMGLGWPYHPSWVMYNFIGFGCLIVVAYTTAWFKKQPWRQATKQPSTNAQTVPAGKPAAAE
jgi:hypothetical protein